MSKPILKLTSAELRTLDASRDLMLNLLLDSRVNGECRDAAALRDGDALIRSIHKLAAVPL